METIEKIFKMQTIYNLSRMLFYKVKYDYNKLIEGTGITLPELRVLWIIEAFPNINLQETAKIGVWTPPTVLKMLEILSEKGLVKREGKEGNTYALNVTDEGRKYIDINRITKTRYIYSLEDIKFLQSDDIKFLVRVFKNITEKYKNSNVFMAMERINELSLEVKFDDFEKEEVEKLKSLILIYNLLRNFIAEIEDNYRTALIEYDVTYPQFRALCILDIFNGITSNKLSQLGFWSASTANLIVKNLYEKDLIYKERSSIKNALFLYLTEKGTTIVKEFAIEENKIKSFSRVEGFELDEIIRLENLLYKLNMAISKNEIGIYVSGSTFFYVLKGIRNKK